MIVNETLEDSRKKLSQLIAELDCEWHKEVLKEETKDEDGHVVPAQYRFTTTITGSKVYVTELYVGFSKPLETEEGLFEDKRQLGDGNKKSHLYKKLVKRFDDNDDISYYNGLYESINNLLEREEEEEEQGDDRPLPLLDSRKGK